MTVPHNYRRKIKEYLENLAGSSEDNVSATIGTVDVDDFNNRRIFDSTGQYLGTLDGTNDGTTLSNAIGNRRSGSGVIVPSPDFNLDWDTTVTIPNEDEFSITTVGVPTIVPQSGFGDNPVMEKKSNSNGADQHIEIGTFNVKNDNDELSSSPALLLDDIAFSDVYRWTVTGAPGLAIKASNSFSARNKIWGWRINSDKGPGIDLRANSNSSDQNWIVAPMFSDQNNKTETAYKDSGKHNNWIRTGCEFAHTVHDQRGDNADVRNYYISEGAWDRSSDYEFTVRERGTAHGQIENVYNGTNVFKMRLVDPNTRITQVGSPAVGNGTAQYGDLLGEMRNLTSARSFDSVGWQTSGAGTVSSTRTFGSHTFIELDTGNSSTGDVAQLDTGFKSFKPGKAYPKAAYSFQPGSTGGSETDDDGSVVVRHGIRQNDDNFAWFIYDPTNKWSSDNTDQGAGSGDHSNSNWYVEVTTGGTNTKSTDTGVSPSSDQLFALNVEEDQNGNNRTSFVIDRSNVFTIDDAPTGQAGYKFEVVTRTTNDSKNWDVKSKQGMRMFRM